MHLTHTLELLLQDLNPLSTQIPVHPSRAREVRTLASAFTAPRDFDLDSITLGRLLPHLHAVFPTDEAPSRIRMHP